MPNEDTKILEMSLDELFASARTAGSRPNLTSMTLHFQLSGCEAERGTLTISRNPASTRWLTTVGVAQGNQYHARIAQGDSVNEVLDKIERYCHWWLRI